MSIDILDQHQIIAWDMDRTLIDGPHSKVLRDFIIAHPEKQHHIVTFRTGPYWKRPDCSWADAALHELIELGVPAERITAVHGVPEAFYAAYEERVADSDLSDDARAFLAWKALRAREIGATVLVDDMQHLVEEGCLFHGVVFVHSHRGFEAAVSP